MIAGLDDRWYLPPFLQQLLRELSQHSGQSAARQTDGRRLLLLPAPREQHTLGLLMGGLGWEFDAAYPVAAWVCWPINLLVCEWLLRRNGLRALPVDTRLASRQSAA